MGKLDLSILVLFISLSYNAQCQLIDDSIHFTVKFTNDQSKIKLADRKPEELTDEDDVVPLVSKNGEKFLCQIPHIEHEEEKSEEYTGESPQEILEKQLYKSDACSYLVDTYWSYMVCHGRYITQFHDDKNSLNNLARTEYYLGNYHVEYPKSKSDILHPKKRMIENENYPIYTVHYNRGTSCDLTGKPRTTDVIYICVPNMQHKILSVTEVASCHYEIIIMTHILCKHPSYTLNENKDHEIVCWNTEANSEETAPPKALQNLNEYHDTTFKREYTINPDNYINNEHIDSIVDVEKVTIETLERAKQVKTPELKLAGEKRYENKDTLANNPLVVDHTVNSILTGEECIVGGQGWWKYEFCYGKQVVQFHEEANGNRLDIVLGVFDETIHKLWVEEVPLMRKPKKNGNHVSQISHLYSKGDLCDETGAHRSVEVRLRCQPAEHSALAISLTLSEPRTCHYILTIDSERFCEPLQYSDDFGMIRLEKKTAADKIAPKDKEEIELDPEDEQEEEEEEEEDDDTEENEEKEVEEKAIKNEKDIKTEL